MYRIVPVTVERHEEGQRDKSRRATKCDSKILFIRKCDF